MAILRFLFRRLVAQRLLALGVVLVSPRLLTAKVAGKAGSPVVFRLS